MVRLTYQYVRRIAYAVVFSLLNTMLQDETKNTVSFCLHRVTHTRFETDRP